MKSGRDSTKSKSTNNKKLSPFVRFILYGLLGITFEVYFYAMLDTLLKGELDLVGKLNGKFFYLDMSVLGRYNSVCSSVQDIYVDDLDYIPRLRFGSMHNFQIVKISISDRGRTNVLILPIYGLGFLLMERIAPYLQHKNVSVYMRGLIYTVMGYTFEFTTGYFLLIIGQDYWDYSDFAYNLKGLIMPHTGLLWTLLGLIAESFIIDWVKRLTLSSK